MRLLATLILSTFLTVAVSTAEDGNTKKTKKADHSCCMEKAGGKAMSSKDVSKNCCSMTKAEMKDKKDAGKMDCCMEQGKSGETKAPSTENGKEAK